jgi:uncharacterized membrane protein
MDAEHLKKHYDLLSDEELLKTLSSELIPQARVILDAEIDKRGLRIDSLQKNTFQPSNKGRKINKFIWLAIFFVTFVIQAAGADFAFAFGLLVGEFTIGIVLSPIWWLFSRRSQTAPWQWFNWLNAAAFIMVGLHILSMAIHYAMKSKFGI